MTKSITEEQLDFFLEGHYEKLVESYNDPMNKLIIDCAAKAVGFSLQEADTAEYIEKKSSDLLSKLKTTEERFKEAVKQRKADKVSTLRRYVVSYATLIIGIYTLSVGFLPLSFIFSTLSIINSVISANKETTDKRNSIREFRIMKGQIEKLMKSTDSATVKERCGKLLTRLDTQIRMVQNNQ